MNFLEVEVKVVGIRCSYYCRFAEKVASFEIGEFRVGRSEDGSDRYAEDGVTLYFRLFCSATFK